MIQNLILKKATEEDYPKLCIMAKESKFTRDFSGISYRWGWKDKITVAIIDNEIVGFYYANVCKRLSRVTLYEIYVIPEMRKIGVGTVLLNDLINKTKNAGKNILRWLLNKKNSAYNFYKKNGFFPIAEDKKHYIYEINLRNKNDLDKFLGKNNG